MTVGNKFNNGGFPKYASIAEMQTIALRSGDSVEVVSSAGGWIGNSVKPNNRAVYNIVTLVEYTAITGLGAADGVNDWALSNANVAMLDSAAVNYPFVTGEVTVVNYQYPPGNVKRYGAIGDGVTDDTTALANASNSGFDVYFPAVTTPATQYYRTTTAVLMRYKGQRFYGDGEGSILRQVTANLNVIEATSFDNLKIENLHVYAVGSRTTTYNGCGIYLNICHYYEVNNCIIENHRGTGILIMDSNNGKVINNSLINSPVVAGELHSQAADDIKMIHSSSRNIISGNHCVSGQAIGISLRSIDAGDSVTDNIVDGNVVRDCIGYGIMAYKQQAADFVENNIITNNAITNITGSMADATDGILYWGAGIYIQFAEYTTVANNVITNTNQLTASDTLAPAAIGVANVSAVNIANNTIRDVTWYGISVRDPSNLGLSTGFANITGNNITNSAKASIQVVERGRVNITGNTVDGSTLQGIHLKNIVEEREFNITNNIVRGSSAAGITTAFSSQMNISENLVINTVGSQSIVVNTGDIISINGNVCEGATGNGTGIQVSANATNVSVNNNIITNNTFGMTITVPTTMSGNMVYGNTGDWNGSFAIITTIDDSGTPSVKYGEKFITSGATAITDFDDGILGQTIEVRAAANVQITDGGALKLAGNFAMTVDDVIVLKMFVDQIWTEVSRSSN